MGSDTKMTMGAGMVMGLGVGIIFAPILGPFGMALCAGIGLVAGGAGSHRQRC